MSEKKRLLRVQNSQPDSVDHEDFFEDLKLLLHKHGVTVPEGTWRIQLLAQPGSKEPRRRPSWTFRSRGRKAMAARKKVDDRERLLEARRESRKLKEHLLKLTRAVCVFLDGFDAAMKTSVTHERGVRLALLANKLNYENDVARRFGLDDKSATKGL